MIEDDEAQPYNNGRKKQFPRRERAQLSAGDGKADRDEHEIF